MLRGCVVRSSSFFPLDCTLEALCTLAKSRFVSFPGLHRHRTRVPVCAILKQRIWTANKTPSTTLNCPTSTSRRIYNKVLLPLCPLPSVLRTTRHSVPLHKLPYLSRLDWTGLDWVDGGPRGYSICAKQLFSCIRSPKPLHRREREREDGENRRRHHQNSYY